MAQASEEVLEKRHAELDKAIGIEHTRRVPDLNRLHTMKKEKLLLKDTLAGH